jgi:hypothetical protein
MTNDLEIKVNEGKKAFTKQINSLLNKAFGTGFLSIVEGDREISSLGSYKNKNGALKEIFKLSYIGFYESYIGSFTSEDGSKLKVSPRYTEQIKEYAELYKEKFGKEVEISLI